MIWPLFSKKPVVFVPGFIIWLFSEYNDEETTSKIQMKEKGMGKYRLIRCLGLFVED
jgi:hypothetical protein